MSEPKRYDPPDILSGESFMQEVQGGEFVRYEDYARLKAEVERLQSVSEAWKKRRLDKVEAECIKWAEVEKENAYLKKIVESHQVDLHLQNARLKAEVERLTKIGDAMAEDLISEFGASDNAYFWYKAKEGKQP